MFCFTLRGQNMVGAAGLEPASAFAICVRSAVPNPIQTTPPLRPGTFHALSAAVKSATASGRSQHHRLFPLYAMPGETVPAKNIIMEAAGRLELPFQH